MAEDKTLPPVTDVEKDTKAAAEEEDPVPVTDIEQGTGKHVDPKLEKHAHDADEAMKAMQGLGEDITIDEETNKRLLRTIDWHLMPIMCFVYGMNYLDSMDVLLRCLDAC